VRSALDVIGRPCVGREAGGDVVLGADAGEEEVAAAAEPHEPGELLRQGEVLVLARAVLRGLQQGEQRCAQSPVDVHPVEELQAPLQPSRPVDVWRSVGEEGSRRRRPVAGHSWCRHGYRWRRVNHPTRRFHSQTTPRYRPGATSRTSSRTIRATMDVLE
jgi:hypothetical protein